MAAVQVAVGMVGAASAAVATAVAGEEMVPLVVVQEEAVATQVWP